MATSLGTLIVTGAKGLAHSINIGGGKLALVANKGFNDFTADKRSLVLDAIEHSKLINEENSKVFIISACIFIASIIAFYKAINYSDRKNENRNKIKEQLTKFDETLKIIQEVKQNMDNESINLVNEFLNTIDLSKTDFDSQLVDKFILYINEVGKDKFIQDQALIKKL